MDIPWSPNRHVKSRVMPARDAEGCLRIFDAGLMPFPRDVLEVHEARLRRPRRARRRAVRQRARRRERVRALGAASEARDRQMDAAGSVEFPREHALGPRLSQRHARRRRLRRLRRSAHARADGARCGDAHPAPHRSHAGLPLRLPRRHVRLMRDDRQRPRALDLPDARRDGRGRRHAGDRTAGQSAGDPRPRHRHVACFSTSGARAMGSFVPTATRHDEFATIAPASRARRAVDAAIECIGCGVCYASCDVVSWNRAYLGPAALNRAWTLVNDPRDGARHERLAAVAGDAGCHACHTHQSCTDRCPKALAPTASIAGLKRDTALAAVSGAIA